jgi:hypothetical protein
MKPQSLSDGSKVVAASKLPGADLSEVEKRWFDGDDCNPSKAGTIGV